MPAFTSYDGTQLGYRVLGDGRPLVCLPGGPGRAVEYFGDLGGLDRSRQLIMLDPRGVGSSEDPADPTTFRVDRLVRDVDALRVHLGLDRMDLLAHSAGAVLGTLYAVAHPERLAHLILLTPGLYALGVDSNAEEFDAALRRRSDEPWYATARAALERIMGGDLTLEAFYPSRAFMYARWDDVTKAHATVGIAERHVAARQGYFADVELDPQAAREALRGLTAPVLLYAGEIDPMVTDTMVREAAPVFPAATVVVQPGASHFPWIDEPAAFAKAINEFLDRSLG